MLCMFLKVKSTFPVSTRQVACIILLVSKILKKCNLTRPDIKERLLRGVCYSVGITSLVSWGTFPDSFIQKHTR